MRPFLFLVVCAGLARPSVFARDEEASATPKAVPATRPEIKLALEALKEREPRLPLPPPTADDPSVNNGRMRAEYLPESWVGSFTRRPPGHSGRNWRDPNAKLDHVLTRSCFWVVSRGNNCHYCLGHQELALRFAGVDDDTVAALDSDWSGFDSKLQAAIAIARRLTLEPQLISDHDIERLKSEFSDDEIIELAYTISRFNATNRWTDGMGLPQDKRFESGEISLVTPTSERFQNTVSIVAPTTRAPRLELPTLQEAKRAIAQCRRRKPRVELLAEEKASAALVSAIGGRPPLVWERAMAQLPETGPAQVATLNTIMTDEHLPRRLKAELALMSAIHNRAWYAAGHAVHRLRKLGVTNAEMVALFEENSQASDGSAEAHRLAAKSTADPHLITDADLARVRDHFSDAETAQIMQVICMSNMFDRFTEALGLPLEEGIAVEASPLP